MRAALSTAGWEPLVPRDRSATTAAVRLAFRALIGQDHRVQPTRPGHAEALLAVSQVLRRQRERARGETVLLPRARLVVPDARFEPWRVELELVDEADPGRWCSADDVWNASPLAAEVAGGPEHLHLLGPEEAGDRFKPRIGGLAYSAENAAAVLAPGGHPSG